MARANSLILPRSTVTTNGGISLPMTDLLSWIGIRPALSSWRAPGTRPGRARGTEDLDAAVAHRVGGDVGRDGARHSWTAPGSSGMASGFTVGAPAMQADAPGGRSRGR